MDRRGEAFASHIKNLQIRRQLQKSNQNLTLSAVEAAKEAIATATTRQVVRKAPLYINAY